MLRDLFSSDEETRRQFFIKYPRRMGAVLAVFGFGLAWICIAEPLREARAGADSVTLWTPAIWLGTFLGLAGLCLIFGHEERTRIFAPSDDETKDRRGKVLVWFLGGMSLVPWLLLKVALAKMGYEWF